MLHLTKARFQTVGGRGADTIGRVLRRAGVAFLVAVLVSCATTEQGEESPSRGIGDCERDADCKVTTVNMNDCCGESPSLVHAVSRAALASWSRRCRNPVCYDIGDVGGYEGAGSSATDGFVAVCLRGTCVAEARDE